MLMWALMMGCLEKVTGIAVPLDPRFYEDLNQVEAGAMGSAAGNGAPSTPFADYTGDTVTVSGTIEAEEDLPVELDVRVPDPTAEGGVRGMGKLSLPGPGTFELVVPEDLGMVEIQAFQDPDVDGPGGDDAFAELKLNVGDADLDGVLLQLVAGARGAPPTHIAAPPGAGSDQGPPPSGSAARVSADPFADFEGDRVQVSGNLNYDGVEDIDLDLFAPDADAPGGRAFIGKLKRKAGLFDLAVPVVIGSLEIEAMVDRDGDGPSAGDPRARYAGNPISLEAGDVVGVDLFLGVQEGVQGTVVPVEPDGPTSLEDEFSRTRKAASGE
jgi:hypothetical protein